MKNITTHSAGSNEEIIEVVEVRRRSVGGLVAAGVAGILCFGIVGASAASLGELKVGALGASSQEVVSCDTDGLSVSWNQELSAKGYMTNVVIVEDISERCEGQVLRVGLMDNRDNVLAEASAIVDGTGVKVELKEAVPSESVTRIATSIASS